MTESGAWGEYPYAENRRVVGIVPAASGWQVVEFYEANREDDGKGGCSLSPVVAWVLVEELFGGNIYSEVYPVTTEDFPTYPCIRFNADGVLAPGERLDQDWQHAADQHAKHLQAVREKRRAEAAEKTDATA